MSFRENISNLYSLACIIVVSSFEDGEDDGVSDENELLDTFEIKVVNLSFKIEKILRIV